MRDEYTHHLLLNWARWKAGACDSGLGYGAGNWSGVREDRYREPVIPTIALEAEQVDRAVSQLDQDLRRTVELMYLRDMGAKAAASHLRVAESTVWARIDRASRKVAESLREIREQAAVRRTAAEATQRAARPTK